MARFVDFYRVLEWYFCSSVAETQNGGGSSDDGKGSSRGGAAPADTIAQNLATDAASVFEFAIAANSGLHLKWKWEVVSACLGEFCVAEHDVAYLYVKRVQAREAAVAAAAEALANANGQGDGQTEHQDVVQAWAMTVRCE